MFHHESRHQHLRTQGHKRTAPPRLAPPSAPRLAASHGQSSARGINRRETFRAKARRHPVVGAHSRGSPALRLLPQPRAAVLVEAQVDQIQREE
jgi:hypothetical protein